MSIDNIFALTLQILYDKQFFIVDWGFISSITMNWVFKLPKYFNTPTIFFTTFTFLSQIFEMLEMKI